MVWSNPDIRKATARYLCIRPTTQPLYHGAGKAVAMRPEASFASGAKNLCLERKVAGLIPRGQFAFHVFNPAVMTVQCSVPTLMRVA